MEAIKTPIEPQYVVTLAMTEQEATTLRELLGTISLVGIEKEHERWSNLTVTGNSTPNDKYEISLKVWDSLKGLGV